MQLLPVQENSVFLSFLGLVLAVIPCLLSRDGVKCGHFSLRSVFRNYSFQNAFTFLLGEKWVLINFLNYINPNSYLDNKMLIVYRK